MISSRETCDTITDSILPSGGLNPKNLLLNGQKRLIKRRLSNNDNIETSTSSTREQLSSEQLPPFLIDNEKPSKVISHPKVISSQQRGKGLTQRGGLDELKRGINQELLDKLKNLSSSVTAPWIRPLPDRPNLTEVLKGPERPVKGINRHTERLERARQMQREFDEWKEVCDGKRRPSYTSSSSRSVELKCTLHDDGKKGRMNKWKELNDVLLV